MSQKDTEQFRLALKQIALDAALPEPESPHPAEPSEPLASLPPEVEDRLVQLAFAAPKEPASAAELSRRSALPSRSQGGAKALSSRRLVWGIPLLAAATLGIIFFSRRTETPNGPVYAALVMSDQLPQANGKLLLRNDTSVQEIVKSRRLRRDETLSLELRPQQKLTRPVELNSFIHPAGQKVRLWEVQPEPGKQGVFLLNIPLREIPNLEPEQDLLFVFGPPGQAPQATQLEHGKLGAQFSILSIHLTVLD